LPISNNFVSATVASAMAVPGDRRDEQFVAPGWCVIRVKSLEVMVEMLEQRVEEE